LDSAQRTVITASPVTIKFWTTKGICIKTFANKKRIKSVLFNNVGDKMITVSEDPSAAIYNADGDKLFGFYGPATTTLLGPTDNTVLIASSNCTATVYEKSLHLSLAEIIILISLLKDKETGRSFCEKAWKASNDPATTLIFTDELKSIIHEAV